MLTNLKKYHAKWKKPGTKSHKLYDFIYIKWPEKQSIEIENRLVVVWGWEWELALAAKRYEGTFRGDRNFLKWNCKFYKFSENEWIVYL